MKLSAFSTNKIFSRLSVKEQALLTKRLSFLIKSGVPLLEGLRMVRRFKSRAKSSMFEQIIKDVENGQSLSFAMAKYRRSFGDFSINIIRVGESIGILDQNLAYLSEELRKEHELRRKIISALIYPIFIIIATLGIVSLILTFVLPKIMPVFTSMRVALPITTRFLIAVSNFAVHWGGWVLLGLAALFLGLWFLIKKQPKVKFFSDRLILKLPFIGEMIRSYQLTSFCRTLGLLLKSGITVGDAMRIIADSTANLVYKHEYEKLAKSISKGKKIYLQLESAPKLFPEIATQMIATGEISGNLSETLIYLSQMYENEVDDLTKNLSSALEPALMIFMGVMVGFLAISIITPIYEITQHITPK